MLKIQSVRKRFGAGPEVLAGIDFSVEAGEIVALVGASGCGKSTLLRAIAGLDPPSSGRIEIDGTIVAGPRPEIGMVFQEPRLMPWLAVRENVCFGLHHLPREARHKAAAEILARVGLADAADKLPRELSGGMAQRVALARALVARPKVLLMDEPFSALDAFTRLTLQDHLLEVWRYDRPTLVLVTHDIDEALALADRVVLMRASPGRVHREIALDLARPRNRVDRRLLTIKGMILNELELTAGRTPREEADRPGIMTF
jgi:sulfonate transport system ATP-binding protein